MKAANGFRLIGLDYRTGKPISVDIQNGLISDISSADTLLDLPWIGPGLVDLQVNGFQGTDFNTLPLTREKVVEATRSLWVEGVTTYLPTVITNRDEAIEEALHSIAETISQDQDHILYGCIAGIHLEGPFISPEDGPRGAHHAAFVKPPDWDLFQRWQHAAEGMIRLVTLSPEWPNAVDFIKRCVESGVKVSIGHTAANSKQIADAVQAGATLSTHLGNGTHPVLPRHPNYIWDQMAEDELWACAIADGFHLPDSFLKTLFRVKREKMILVSDSVYFGGMEPGIYQTHIGGSVVLTKDGKLHLADQPQLLAGSVQSLRQGVAILTDKRICGMEVAWNMASLHPSIYLELDTRCGLTVGSPADLVVFERLENEIRIQKTIKHGLVQYERSA